MGVGIGDFFLWMGGGDGSWGYVLTSFGLLGKRRKGGLGGRLDEN